MLWAPEVLGEAEESALAGRDGDRPPNIESAKPKSRQLATKNIILFFCTYMHVIVNLNS
jgi:hypothetical protein